jgi:dienelactone hydrolase
VVDHGSFPADSDIVRSDGVVSRPLSYEDGAAALTGTLCLDDGRRDARPGILVIHGGGGLDEHALGQARRYGELGYVVLAADMFGAGVAGDRERVMGCLRALRDDPRLLVGRVRAGLAALTGCAEVSAPLAVVGFCFGGMAALASARAGVRVPGVVSIHGSLATDSPAAPHTLFARVLVCHGAADPHVPMRDVTAFAAEMDGAGADWQLIAYGQALHGFTHRHARPGARPGIAYDARADRRSFRAVREFLGELPGPGN